MKERKDRKPRTRARAKLQSASRRRFDGAAASQRQDGNLRAGELPPDDTRLREFVADFYAAISMMRLLRQEIASTLSLTSAEYSVLLAVWYLERKNEMTVRAIADHLHVAAAYVTSEISRLVAKGFLTKKRDMVDRRAVGVGLTDTARNLLSRLEHVLRDVNRPLFLGLSFRDLAAVHRFLRAIIENGPDAIRAAQDSEFGLPPQRKTGSLGN
jgi:DNA-binding MarR family transcriptional regulator